MTLQHSVARSERGGKTPVTLVTGFLGSGKTTLISRLLAHPDMGETAVIVNELGEVGIDHHLLRRVDERTVLLASGCVCCTLRGDLADELRDLDSAGPAARSRPSGASSSRRPASPTRRRSSTRSRPSRSSGITTCWTESWRRSTPGTASPARSR